MVSDAGLQNGAQDNGGGQQVTSDVGTSENVDNDLWASV
jgi:hypothetical protein